MDGKGKYSWKNKNITIAGAGRSDNNITAGKRRRRPPSQQPEQPDGRDCDGEDVTPKGNQNPIDLAKERLDNEVLVGLTSRMDESTVLFVAALQLPLPTLCSPMGDLRTNTKQTTAAPILADRHKPMPSHDQHPHPDAEFTLSGTEPSPWSRSACPHCSAQFLLYVEDSLKNEMLIYRHAAQLHHAQYTAADRDGDLSKALRTLSSPNFETWCGGLRTHLQAALKTQQTQVLEEKQHWNFTTDEARDRVVNFNLVHVKDVVMRDAISAEVNSLRQMTNSTALSTAGRPGGPEE